MKIKVSILSSDQGPFPHLLLGGSEVTVWPSKICGWLGYAWVPQIGQFLDITPSEAERIARETLGKIGGPLP